MISIVNIRQVLPKIWDDKTCYPSLKHKWDKKNPCLGQCAVTSLIVQDIYGGEILFCKSLNHYWNKLPNGKHLDLTRDQFPSGSSFDKYIVSNRDFILDIKHESRSKTNKRYKVLKKRLLGKLEKLNNFSNLA